MVGQRQFEIFQHYKGGLYLKLCVARYTESDERMVVYACAVSGEVWCRPEQMFTETVTWQGRVVPRFRPVPFTEDKGARQYAAVLDADGGWLADGAAGGGAGAGGGT